MPNKLSVPIVVIISSILLFFQIYTLRKAKNNLPKHTENESLHVVYNYWESVEDEISLIIKNVNPNLQSDTLNRITGSIIKFSKKYYLNPYLVTAIIYCESHFIPNVEGKVGDAGLMQIIPSTAEHIANQLDLKNYNLFDIETNIEFGCWYLSKIKLLSEGNYIEALARYNQGGNWRGGGERYAFSIIREAEKIGIPLRIILLEEKMNFRTTIAETHYKSSINGISEEIFEDNMY